MRSNNREHRLSYKILLGTAYHSGNRHRHLPKPIYKAASLRRTMVDTERKKDERRRAYNASGSITKCPFLNARIIKEIEWLPCSSVMAYYHLIGYFKGFGAVRNAQERGRDAIIHKGKTVTGIRWLDLSHWVSHWDKLAIEVVKMEYANAQLECSAADERAKILASEVIGLEEKALRLRSSELKLERQLENSTAEINYYPGKLVV